MLCFDHEERKRHDHVSKVVERAEGKEKIVMEHFCEGPETGEMREGTKVCQAEQTLQTSLVGIEQVRKMKEPSVRSVCLGRRTDNEHESVRRERNWEEMRNDNLSNENERTWHRLRKRVGKYL